MIIYNTIQEYVQHNSSTENLLTLLSAYEKYNLPTRISIFKDNQDIKDILQQLELPMDSVSVEVVGKCHSIKLSFCDFLITPTETFKFNDALKNRVLHEVNNHLKSFKSDLEDDLQDGLCIFCIDDDISFKYLDPYK